MKAIYWYIQTGRQRMSRIVCLLVLGSFAFSPAFLLVNADDKNEKFTADCFRILRRTAKASAYLGCCCRTEAQFIPVPR